MWNQSNGPQYPNQQQNTIANPFLSLLGAMGIPALNYPLPTGLTGRQPRKDLPKETIAGPIIAWRTWKLSSDGSGRLIGVYQAYSWPRMPAKAVCAHSGHPASGCQCGWYAMKARPSEVGPDQIIGKVALWGKVISHQHGYRAEYAYPIELFLELPMPRFELSFGYRHELEMISKNYNCPIRITAKGVADEVRTISPEIQNARREAAG